MLPKLSAIEIAEAALLADIAVVIHLLVIFLPVGGGTVSLLIPIVFAILVLRRSLYAASMGFCVAVGIVALLTGPGSAIIMLPEGGAGLFLGFTMRHRLGHYTTFLLGVTTGALTMYCLTFLFTWLSGLPFTHIIQAIQRDYITVLHAVGAIAASAGLAHWWTQRAQPLLLHLGQIVFTYWWGFLYVGWWFILCPVVIVVYYVTNVFVRLFGYDVRPFPGGKLERIGRRIGRAALRQGIKRRIVRRSQSSA
jgi:uncharacterized protein YybS (DUF2232 family)